MTTAPVSAGPIERLEFEAAELMREHPPAIHAPNKLIVLGIACPPGAVHSGRLGYSRWAEMQLPGSVNPARAAERVAIREGFFSYRPLLHPDAGFEWQVNFADPVLFGYYGGGAFAQDEMQVAEHPALGALREALLAAGLPARTEVAGRPTPVLVTGVERRVNFHSEPKPEDRPEGLYGRRFRMAPPFAIRLAAERIDPPTISNVIAIAAPQGGHGRYTRETIEIALGTAFTGFRAAVIETERITPGREVVIHTGFWGAGAFGGNPVLLSLLQILAAEMAGVPRLVFYTGTPSRLHSLERAMEAARSFGPGELKVAEAIDRIDAMGYEWGSGDGN